MLNYDPRITEVVSYRGASKHWNDLHQKLETRAVQNFHTRQQACVDKAGGHTEHFMW